MPRKKPIATGRSPQAGQDTPDHDLGSSSLKLSGVALPNSYIQKHISFPPLAVDEVSEQELCLHWGLLPADLLSLVVQGKLAAVEQRCPVRVDIPATLIPFRCEDATDIANGLGLFRTAVRLVFKIPEVERYARVSALSPLSVVPRHAASPPEFTIGQPPLTEQPLAVSELSVLSVSASLSTEKLLAEYKQAKLSEGAWRVSSLPDHENRLRYLIEIIGNKPVQEISRADMKHVKEILQKLPPNRTRSPRYRGKSISELVLMSHEKTLNVKTVNIIMEALASFFEWCVREEYINKNPAKFLQTRDIRDPKSLRDAFTYEEIRQIFQSEDYLKLKSVKPHFFWTSLIALYTGMRLEEICQLHCGDIRLDAQSSHWIIDICDAPDADNTMQKHIKTRNARRSIPIHKALIDAGLLAYVQAMEGAGHPRIFPQLRRTEKTPKYGKQVSKVFSVLLKTLDITGKKSFHSLRHSFSHYFHERGLHNDVFRQVFGHEIEGLAGRQYGAKFGIAKCYDEIIAKIDWGLFS